MMYKTLENTAPLCRGLALLLALALLLGALAGCSGGSKQSEGAGVKSITLTVVHRDGTSKDFPIETHREMLGEALLDEGLIGGEEGQYGLFVTKADGEEADEGQHEFWSLSIAGEMATTGVDSTPVEDGGQYELTLTTY